MKKAQILHTEFRAKTRELIQGFIEHCEISRNLVGQIQHFVQFADRKYGLPVFTIYGPDHPEFEQQRIGMIGHNDANDSTTPETLLQLIERLTIQPHVAAGTILRVLPIADPIGLELGETIHSQATAEHSAYLSAFRKSGHDGLIDIRRIDGDFVNLRASGAPHIRAAIRRAWEAMERLSSEDSILTNSDTSFELSGELPWNVVLEVPRNWSATLAVHWVSQFLVVFLRAHTEELTSSQIPTI